MAAGMLVAALYGFFVIRLRANQIVAGTAINMLALGLTPSLCKVLYDVTGSTPAIPIGGDDVDLLAWLGRSSIAGRSSTAVVDGEGESVVRRGACRGRRRGPST